MTLFEIITVLSAAAAAAAALGSGKVWLLPVLFMGNFLLLTVVAALFLVAVCGFVDRKKPQEHDSRFYRAVMNLYIDTLIRVTGLRVRTAGLEKTPGSGRFLLVCNHLCDIDPAILLARFKKSQLAFITKRENCDMFLVGPIMHKTMCQPINRENDREALKTILRCIRLLEEDEVSVAVFPEGYVSTDGKLHRFRSGVFKIAQRAGVPVVVCTLRGTKEAVRRLKKGRTSEVELHLVDVIQPEQYAGMTAVELGNLVYRKMAEDLGPALVRQDADNT